MTEQVIENQVIVVAADGEEYCDDELALSEMLKSGDLHCNTGKFDSESTIVLFVSCSDVFAWGCADSESFTTADILPLYKMFKQGSWGAAKWCCIKRNEKPQRPVEKRMRDSGIWDDVMEALPENYYDAQCKKMYEERKAKELAEQEKAE